MSFGRRKIPRHLIIHDDYVYRGYIERKKNQGLGWLLLGVLVLLISMLVSIKVSAEENLETTRGGQLMFKSDYGKYEQSLHLNSHADVDINGMIAHVSLSQVFTNDSDEWREGVYAFPLPENAAVKHMEIRIGERVIVGEIKEKQTARKIYQQALKQGKRAALTEQNRPNIFIQRVANIPPWEEVEVRLTYIHSVRYDQGEFSWRLPMTITPRYRPAPMMAAHARAYAQASQIELTENHSSVSLQTSLHNGWAMSVDQPDPWPLPASVYEFLPQSVEHPMTLTIQLNSGLPLANIDSMFHPIRITKQNAQHQIVLNQEQTNMDRDFVLTWRPVASSAPQAALFSEEVDGDYYSLLMLMPPQLTKNATGLARDMVFVIDISGSMQGSSIRQAKSGLSLALSQLTDRDRFNIIAFNNNFQKFNRQTVPASSENLTLAVDWVNRLSANGGTNMQPALEAALDQFSQSELLQQTVFITDGAVANETQLFHSIRNKLGDSRLFTVGIGSAPNSYFMKKAAEFGRGSFTHIGDTRQLAKKIDGLFAKLDSAAAKNIHVNWSGNAEIYPNKIPDLYYSEPLLVSAKSRDLKGDIKISGQTASETWEQYISLDGHKRSDGIATVWARAKIGDLEDLKISGGDKALVKAEITDVALTHKLVSAHTSFVAVEQAVIRGPDQHPLSTPVHNAVPHGHRMAQRVNAVSYPSTATSAQLTLWLGLLCMLLLAFVARRKGSL